MTREWKLACLITIGIIFAFWLGVIRPYSHRFDAATKFFMKHYPTITPTPTVKEKTYEF